MQLNHESGYYWDVTVPHGMKAVKFIVQGGPAACHVYRADDLGVRWVWMASRSVMIPNHAVTIAVTAGWLIRVKMEPIDVDQAQQTTAKVSFDPLNDMVT